MVSVPVTRTNTALVYSPLGKVFCLLKLRLRGPVFDGQSMTNKPNPNRDDLQDWTNTQLMHVYQGQLVTGMTAQNHTDGAFVDLRNQESFHEKFYLVVLEHAADQNSYLHMWEIIISSSHEGTCCLSTLSR